MKKHIIFLLTLIPGMLTAQVSDDFSDGDFIQNPPWTGHTEHFEVNESKQLHLNSTGTDTSFLTTPVSVFRETEWDFWIKLSFNTSINNHVRIILISDQSDPEIPQNGYYLQIGGSSDSIWLYRQNGMSLVPLLHVKQFSTAHSVNQFRFKVIRGETADWSLFADSAGNKNFMAVGTVHDEMMIQEGHFGIRCRYTSSNASKIYFDDLYVGPLQRDTIKPVITSLSVQSQNKIAITWSEALDITTSSDTSHYLLKQSGQIPLSADTDPENPVRTLLTFLHPLPDPGCDSLSVRGITDPSGNGMNHTLVEICHYRARAYDVLIHEIMPDPEPANTLPPAEYIELFNRSEFAINLENWNLQAGSGSYTFPLASIAPGGYLILCNDTSFRPYGSILPLISGTSVLSNDGASLVLKDDSGRIIHSAAYTKDWFAGNFKEEGGWSLEMKDPSNPCGCRENWAASTDLSGGTPGRANSVAEPVPDHNPPNVRQGIIFDAHRAEIVFSESMDSISFQDPLLFEMQPGPVFPDSVIRIPPDYHSVHLGFDAPFDTGIIYTLNIHGGLRDCAGNRTYKDTEQILAFPQMATPGSIVINEILANPYAGGSRFIELYNRSEIAVDLKELSLIYHRDGEEVQQNGIPLTYYHWLLLPGRYAALCRDCEDVMNRYPDCDPVHFLQMKTLPAFSAGDGVLRLIRKSDEGLIDMLSYSETMHDPLLSITEGVSLERIDPFRPSSDSTNWHSAAHTSGYATPGAENSQYFRGKTDDGTLRIDPPVFSPDNDGRDDVLSIICMPGQPGMKSTLCIYDSRGMPVRQLANTILAEPQFTLTWDGTTDSRLRAPAGIYIILLRVADNSGNARSYKKTAVLATEF